MPFGEAVVDDVDTRTESDEVFAVVAIVDVSMGLRLGQLWRRERREDGWKVVIRMLTGSASLPDLFSPQLTDPQLLSQQLPWSPSQVKRQNVF